MSAFVEASMLSAISTLSLTVDYLRKANADDLADALADFEPDLIARHDLLVHGPSAESQAGAS